MLPKKFLSKTLNAVSSLALSGVLLGSAFSTTSWGMEGVQNETRVLTKIFPKTIKENIDELITSAPPIIVANDVIPTDMVLHILRFVDQEEFLSMASIARGFHAASWHPTLNRRILKINSDERLKLILTNAGQQNILSVPGIKITHEAHPTLEDIKKVLIQFSFLKKFDLSGDPDNRQLNLIEILPLCCNNSSLTELNLNSLETQATDEEHAWQARFNWDDAFKNNSTLRSLGLRNNNLYNEAAHNMGPVYQWIYDSLETNTTLTSLDLSYNNIEFFADFLKFNNSITTIDLSHNNIMNFSLYNIAKNNTLKKLNLSYNISENILNNDEFFKHNTTLTELNLQHNKINERVRLNDGYGADLVRYHDGVDEFGHAKWKNFNTPLKLLNLAENNLSDDDARGIVSLLNKCNSSLTKLNLRGNQSLLIPIIPDITPETFAKVDEMLERNKLRQGL